MEANETTDARNVTSSSQADKQAGKIFSSQQDETTKNWIIRPMRRQDLDKCLQIWAQVDLTEAKQTVASALAADPLGFYVAELEQTGEVIGMCAGNLTRPDTAFMGFYAVEPKHQRLGIGRELWARTIGRLDSSTNVGLYGVPDMSAKYRRSGFVVEDPIRMIIYESDPNEPDKLRLEQLNDASDLAADCRLVRIDKRTGDRLFRKLLDYDQSVQRFSREKLLRLYLQADDSPLTLAVVKDVGRQQQQWVGEQRKLSCSAKPSEQSIIEDETLSSAARSALSLSANDLPVDVEVDINTDTDCRLQQTQILGFGCIRLDNNAGGMIGPIYADSSDLAEILLRRLIELFPISSGQKYTVMSLSSNKQASNSLLKLGLHEFDQCSRLFTKFVPTASMSKIYYVHSPNFTLF